ncbi:MAG: M28 family peptidase [Candidatus Acidiferrum sp.]
MNLTTTNEFGCIAMTARGFLTQAILCACVALFSLTGCKAKSDEVQGARASAAASAGKAELTAAEQAGMNDALPPEKTGGFDGKLAFQHVAKQVGFGPRPSGSPAIAQTQEYILTQLKSFGCTTEMDAFSTDTPVGRLSMKNILVKIPGEQPGIIMLATHYDTVLRDDIKFVGADDSGSSTGVMLEIARLLCPARGKNAVWIAFFDGEEAMKVWSETDSRYGSRQMAAKLAASGDITKIKAFLLADLVGSRELHFMRDPTTKSLTDVVWKTAGRLGYGEHFLEQSAAMEDDHNSFAKRKVPVVDVIDLDREGDVAFWHTADDTLDKISAKSLAITGHVFLESVKELQK